VVAVAEVIKTTVGKYLKAKWGCICWFIMGLEKAFDSANRHYRITFERRV
jgi:hypothetical protein